MSTTRESRDPTRRRAGRIASVNAGAWIRGAVGVVGLGVVLEILSRVGFVNPAFLPPFSEVVVKAIELFGDPGFRTDVWSTFVTWALGISIAILIAVPLGILLALSEVTYNASRTVIELIRPLPAVALIPLVLLVAGQGIEMKLIIAVYASLWPILFNTIYGVHGVDPKAQEMARTFGLSRLAIVRRVVIPAASPFIATGVRLSSAIVLIVIITVELIVGGADGIGAFIAQKRAIGNEVVAVYAGILVAGLLGLAINLILGALQRRWLSWDSTTRGRDQ